MSPVHPLQFSCASLGGLGLGGGGIVVRNFTAIYRNFSVMPLFKNFIFPLRKILSLPLL